MTWTRPQTFEPGAFLRSCDICGIRFRSTQLVRGEDGFWRCTYSCVEVPPITRDKIIAQSQRRKEAPPPPHGIPYDTKDTYAAEAQVLRFLVGAFVSGNPAGLGLNVAVAAAEGAYAFTGGTGYLAAGETARYCHDLIVENKRPTQWITLCSNRLKAIADAIILNQVGFGVSSTSTLTTDAHYGALLNPNSTLYDSEENAGCGLALLYAYQIFGTPNYLLGAQAIAHYLRNVQAIGAVGTFFTSSDSAGTVPLYTGGIAQSVAPTVNFLCNHLFYPSGLIALEFFNLLFQTAGDALYGCPNVLNGAFTASASALLSRMIGDLRAFWSVGALDAVTSKVTTGLSATTPAEAFNAFPAVKPQFSLTGSGAWEYQDGPSATGTMLQSSCFAGALRSLFAYEGYSTQVAAVWTWLMNFGSNPAFQCAPGTLASDYPCASTSLAANPPAPPGGQGNIVPPSYQPKLALTTLLQVRDPLNGYAPIARNGSSVYDWSTTGMMAAIQSSQDAGAMRKAKDRITAGYTRVRPEFTFGAPVREESLLLRGFSGLAFQFSSPDIHGAAA